MDNSAKVIQQNGEECRICGEAPCDKHSWTDEDGNNICITQEPHLDLNEAVTAIRKMGLASVNVGDYLIILNNNIDVTVGDEPYVSFILFYHTTSGRFFKRIWNKTVATGATTDLATLVKVCSAYFNQGKPCLSFIKCDGQYELPEKITSACCTFMTKNGDSGVKMCSECEKVRDTITDGMRVEQDIKTEDFEYVNDYSQYEQPPYEEVFDGALGQDNEVDNSEKVSGERPNISYKELITEALEDGKTLYVDEIRMAICQKHSSFAVSDNHIRRSLSREGSLFERVSPLGGSMRGLWRLNMSKEVSDKCEYCDKSFPQGRKSAKYMWHMKAWHGRNNFHCPSCNFKAYFATEVFAHIEEVRHKDSRVACPMCNDSFDKAEMAVHYRGCFQKKQREHVKKVNLVNTPCPTCGKVIKTKRAYKAHLMMHLREQGEQDSVAVPYSNGEKKNLYFYCDKCNNKYTERYSLKKHVQACQGIGFKCDQCSLTLTTVHQLRKHKKLEHSTEIFACKFCGKRFVSQYTVQKHEKCHQEPQFQCSICAKGLKSKANLIAHERSHRGEKPFKCTSCNDGFISLPSLRQHERGVHKISGPKGGKTGWSGKGTKGIKKERKDIKDII